MAAMIERDLRVAIARCGSLFSTYWALRFAAGEARARRERWQSQVLDTVLFQLVFFLLLSGYQAAGL